MGLFGKQKNKQSAPYTPAYKPPDSPLAGQKPVQKPVTENEDGQEALGEKKKPTLLLHACCGPCATYPLEKIAEDYEIKALFYNPNITDIHEYNLRRQNLEYFLKNRRNTYPWDGEIEMFDEVYDPQRFLDLVKGFENQPEGGERCQICIAFRMEATALAAQECGFDYFTTTLSVSPHKNSEWIQEVGQALEEKYQVRYLDENFKKNNGYARSREISIEYRLYRQKYCGCIFSKKEMQKRNEEQELAEREEKLRQLEENRLKESDIRPEENEHAGGEL